MIMNAWFHYFELRLYRNPQLPIARGGFPIYPVSELLPIPASSLEKKVSPLAAVGLWYELI